MGFSYGLGSLTKRRFREESRAGSLAPSPPARAAVRRPFEGLAEALALAGKLEDGGVVHQPVDGGHGVFEDLVPLAEDQVGGDDHGRLLVAVGEKGEEHLSNVSDRRGAS